MILKSMNYKKISTSKKMINKNSEEIKKSNDSKISRKNLIQSYALQKLSLSESKEKNRKSLNLINHFRRSEYMLLENSLQSQDFSQLDEKQLELKKNGLLNELEEIKESEYLNNSSQEVSINIFDQKKLF